MKRSAAVPFVILPLLLSLCGCNSVGDKATSMSVIYGVVAVLSFLLLVGYLTMIKEKETWFVFLFSSVLVINVGYFALSLCQTVEAALHANRISYLGSVFLPLVMFFTILNVCRIPYKKWLVVLLSLVSVAVFLIAASPGILDIYYKDAYLVTVNGVSVLKKVYGPLHCIYLYYLLLYFAAMITVAIVAAVQKRIRSTARAIVILSAVFVNIGVWLLEQLVDIDFEMLSVSYIISELFLLGVCLVMQDAEKLFVAKYGYASTFGIAESAKAESSAEAVADSMPDLQCENFRKNLLNLTHTERMVFDHYVDGKSSREIMQLLNIKENTLKYHNKNIYSKLGVSSRKQLIGIAKQLEITKTDRS